MHKTINWKKITFVTGVILFILGTVDPLEGSILIIIGSAMIATIAWLDKRKFWKWHLIAAVAIGIGVAFMFYFSNLGGWGGESTLSWWWATLLIPYPVGWLINVVCLIASAVKKRPPDK